MLTALIQFCVLVYSLFSDFDATAVGQLAKIYDNIQAKPNKT